MKMGTSRLWTCIILILVGSALVASSANAGLFGLFRSKKKSAPVVRQSLVVFPFDHGSITNLPESFGEYVASDVRSMLASNPRYAVFLYRDKLAPIQRAKVDNTLKAPDCTGPFAEDKAKTLRLAQLLAAELYLVGTIDEYRVDPAAKVAEITLSADLYDAKTGKLLKTLLVKASTPESTNTSHEDELRDLAKGAAVTKLVAELTAEPGETTAPASSTATGSGK